MKHKVVRGLSAFFILQVDTGKQLQTEASHYGLTQFLNKRFHPRHLNRSPRFPENFGFQGTLWQIWSPTSVYCSLDILFFWGGSLNSTKESFDILQQFGISFCFGKSELRCRCHIPLTKMHQLSLHISPIAQSLGAATLTEPKGTCARCSPERGASGQQVAVWKLLSPKPSQADAWTGTPLEWNGLDCNRTVDTVEICGIHWTCISSNCLYTC